MVLKTVEVLPKLPLDGGDWELATVGGKKGVRRLEVEEVGSGPGVPLVVQA